MRYGTEYRIQNSTTNNYRTLTHGNAFRAAEPIYVFLVFTTYQKYTDTYISVVFFHTIKQYARILEVGRILKLLLIKLPIAASLPATEHPVRPVGHDRSATLLGSLTNKYYTHKYILPTVDRE